MALDPKKGQQKQEPCEAGYEIFHELRSTIHPVSADPNPFDPQESSTTAGPDVSNDKGNSPDDSSKD